MAHRNQDYLHPSQIPLPAHSRKFDYDTGSGIFMPVLLGICSASKKPIFRHLL
jgi:hypothetical protein